MRLVLALLLLLAPTLAAAASGHVLKPGETLAQVAETFYGHRHYQLVIIKLNKIKDPAHLAPGTNVRVPELAEMLMTEGFPKDLQPELEKIVKARYGLLRVHAELDRALHPGNGEGKPKVPATIRNSLRKDADTLEQNAKILARMGNFSDSATRMRQRFVGAAGVMRQLAAGSAEKGLEDKAHLLFAQAFVRGLMWARNEDGDLKEWPEP